MIVFQYADLPGAEKESLRVAFVCWSAQPGPATREETDGAGKATAMRILPGWDAGQREHEATAAAQDIQSGAAR